MLPDWDLTAKLEAESDRPIPLARQRLRDDQGEEPPLRAGRTRGQSAALGDNQFAAFAEERYQFAACAHKRTTLEGAGRRQPLTLCLWIPQWASS